MKINQVAKSGEATHVTKEILQSDIPSNIMTTVAELID